jgi:serine kinase of HPr protein (carbohydrate metabolism regulator)
MTRETVHASCIAIGGRAVLIRGASGSGKSDLALRLIDRGASLVSDDYTELTADGDRLLASPPTTIAGKLEIRGVGIIEIASVTGAPVALLVDLAGTVERLPEPRADTIAGVAIPTVALAALEASAPIKLETALLLHGLSFA